MWSRVAGIVAIVVACATGGVYAVRQPAQAQQAREWPMDARDRLAWEGTDARIALLDARAAPVISDARVRQAVIEEALNIGLRAGDVIREAERARGGVALVRSGSMWVERRG